MSKPTFGSLFAGIGGIDLGLERAGWECRWMVEINDYCRAVLTKHWPDVPKYGDIRELIGQELEPTDLICGGFPCQPVSLAGRRLGTADKRWLWPEFARILRVLRPRFVLVENVPGLLSRGMGDVLGDLVRLGYDAEWESLPAAAVGAPHLRYREFLVAYPGGVRGTDKRQTTQHEEWASVATDPYRFWRWVQPQCVSQRTSAALPGGDGEARVTTHSHSEGRPYIFRGTTTATLEGLRTTGMGHWDEWPDIPPAIGQRINPEWAEWYMGFPRGWTDVEGAKPKQRVSALGNAVVPQVAEWVGKRILEAWQP